MIKDRLTDFCGNGLSHNYFINAFCAMNSGGLSAGFGGARVSADGRAVREPAHPREVVGRHPVAHDRLSQGVFPIENGGASLTRNCPHP